MNLAALPVTNAMHEPEIPFARHQRNSESCPLVVVINGDGELTSTASSVATEMLLVRTWTKTYKKCVLL